MDLLKKNFYSYDPSKYDRPSVTVDMLIFTVTEQENKNYRKLPDKELRLLMVKRGDHPYIGQWALPGGFVREKESLEEAALRELKEETNIDNVYIEQLFSWGKVDRDPRTRVISVSYMSLIDSPLKYKGQPRCRGCKWFAVNCKLMDEKKTVTDGLYFRKSIS